MTFETDINTAPEETNDGMKKPIESTYLIVCVIVATPTAFLELLDEVFHSSPSPSTKVQVSLRERIQRMNDEETIRQKLAVTTTSKPSLDIAMILNKLRAVKAPPPTPVLCQALPGTITYYVDGAADQYLTSRGTTLSPLLTDARNRILKLHALPLIPGDIPAASMLLAYLRTVDHTDRRWSVAHATLRMARLCSLFSTGRVIASALDPQLYWWREVESIDRRRRDHLLLAVKGCMLQALLRVNPKSVFAQEENVDVAIVQLIGNARRQTILFCKLRICKKYSASDILNASIEAKYTSDPPKREYEPTAVPIIRFHKRAKKDFSRWGVY